MSELNPGVAPLETQPRIYAASRASVPERPAMWQKLRAEGACIVSSWIDEAEPGATADLGMLWMRIQAEIRSADRLVLYVEPGDFPLKGALVEVGMAIGMGKPVVIVAPKVALEDGSLRPLGSWATHPSVTFCTDISKAVKPGTDQTATPSLTYPIVLNDAQIQVCDEWAKDNLLWTTKETATFNLRTFARAILAKVPAGTATPVETASLEQSIIATLKKHWLSNIECDHEAKTDRSVCACGIWVSYPQPNVGEAVQRWIEHIQREAGLPRVESSPLVDFDDWWQTDGKFFDPDTEDVPWFDKRKDLAEFAFNRGKARANVAATVLLNAKSQEIYKLESQLIQVRTELDQVKAKCEQLRRNVAEEPL